MNVLDFNINQKFDVETGEKREEIFLRLYVSSVKRGLVAKLGPTKFATLIVIASYMDSEGYCYPTQRQISDALGVSPTTANKYVNELIEFEVSGQAILKREFTSGRLGKRSVYRVMPISQLAIFESKIESLDRAAEIEKRSKTVSNEKPMNSKDVITYFCRGYHEKYGVNYAPNFAREGSMIKNKLIGAYSDEQIKKIIDVVIENYGQKWSNDRFPRPTIAAICTFLANEALSLIGKEEEKMREIEQKLEKRVDYESQMEKFLENNDLFA